MNLQPHTSPVPLRVAVLAGGESAEREVSLESGRFVAEALRGRGHEVTRIDPAEVDLRRVDWNDHDVAFLALHGKYGEDGHIQQQLANWNVAYTGSDPVASKLAMSKSAAKERFAQQHVPTLPYVLIDQSDDAARIETQCRKLGYPLVVKPDAQGSSLGVSFVQSSEELAPALNQCFHYDSFGVLEPLVAGTEWTLGIIDDQPLPLIRIATGRDFYDYQAKYEDNDVRYEFEFDVPAPVVQAIERAGCQAAAALGTRGIARVDILLDRFQQPWVLEVNTIPGFTSHSLVPKAAEKIGWDMGLLCEDALMRCLQEKAAPAHS